MTKRLLLLLACLTLGSCTPVDYQALQDSAVARMRQAVAERFASQFGHTIDSVLAGLAGEGGFLHNPLVKVLLPPPFGLALAVGQAMAADPQEALLDVLINRAAEDAIPVIGPVLKDSLQALVVEGRLDALLSGEPGAVTEALRAESGDRLKAALVPAIGKSLEKTGAGQLYSTLVAVRAQAQAVQTTIDQAGALTQVDEPEDLDALFGLLDEEPTGEQADGTLAEGMDEDEPSDLETLLGPASPAATTAATTPLPTETALNPEDLDDYIADKAVDGVFKLLAEREQKLRATLEMPEGI